MNWLRSAEKVGEKGNEGGADESDTTARHQLLHSLRLRAGIVIAVPFKQVNGSPDAETGTEGDDKSLENADCALEKRHSSSSSTTFRTADDLVKWYWSCVQTAESGCCLTSFPFRFPAKACGQRHMRDGNGHEKSQPVLLPTGENALMRLCDM